MWEFKHGHLIKCYSIIGPPIDHFWINKKYFSLQFLIEFWWIFMIFNLIQFWMSILWIFAYFWKGSKSFDYCLITQDSQLESVKFIEKLNLCLVSWWFYKNSLRLTMITCVSPTNCWSASRKSSSNRKLVINTIPN